MSVGARRLAERKKPLASWNAPSARAACPRRRFSDAVCPSTRATINFSVRTASFRRPSVHWSNPSSSAASLPGWAVATGVNVFSASAYRPRSIKARARIATDRGSVAAFRIVSTSSYWPALSAFSAASAGVAAAVGRVCANGTWAAHSSISANTMHTRGMVIRGRSAISVIRRGRMTALTRDDWRVTNSVRFPTSQPCQICNRPRRSSI